MSYMYGAPSKARNALLGAPYIYIYDITSLRVKKRNKLLAV